MAIEFPESVPGFMSHLVTVMKAHSDVEDPAWRVYDEMFREKMASTGVRKWLGMDVKIYQEVCGGRQRRAQNVGRSGGAGLI